MQSSGTLLPFDHFDRAQGKLAQDSAQGDTLMCHPESFNKKFVLIEKDELSSRVPRLCRGVSRDTLFEFISRILTDKSVLIEKNQPVLLYTHPSIQKMTSSFFTQDDMRILSC